MVLGGTIESSRNMLFTPVAAVSYLVFTLLYSPCGAAIAAVKREMNSGLKAAGFALLQCGIAWIAAFIVYNFARLVA